MYFHKKILVKVCFCDRATSQNMFKVMPQKFHRLQYFILSIRIWLYLISAVLLLFVGQALPYI